MKVSLLSVDSIVKTAGGFAAGVAATLGVSQRAKDGQRTLSRLDDRARPALSDKKSVSAAVELQEPYQTSGHAVAPANQGLAQVDADAYFLITNS